MDGISLHTCNSNANFKTIFCFPFYMDKKRKNSWFESTALEHTIEIVLVCDECLHLGSVRIVFFQFLDLVMRIISTIPMFFICIVPDMILTSNIADIHEYFSESNTFPNKTWQWTLGSRILDTGSIMTSLLTHVGLFTLCVKVCLEICLKTKV